MARVAFDPYTHNSNIALMTPGTVFDGLDRYGLPARFRYVRHRNAVAVVTGHCAILAILPTSAGVFEVTNDVAGGSVTPIAGPIACGAYCMTGVTQDYYCVIMVQGFHDTLLGDGSVAAGEAITGKAADGTWDTAASTIPTSGWCIVDDTGSPTVFPGYVKCI